jgi:cytoskeletal protein CcmA (bactofilin family)
MAKTVTPLVHIDYNLVDTTFDKNTDFQGELRFEHSLKINGKFRGTIKTDGFLYIGKSAEVSADIEAGILILEGTVRGNIIARDRIEMMSTGRLYGDLDTAKLQIADGVVFEGNCRMIKERTAPQAPPPAPKPREESTVRI